MVNAKNGIGVIGLSTLMLVCLLAPAHTALAQAPQAAPWMQVTVIHVEPAMVDEYISVQRDFAARAKKAATPGRTVSRVEVGDNYQFIITSPVTNLASFDTAGRNADPELTALNAKMLKYVTSQHNYVIRSIPEIDNPLPGNQSPAVMIFNFARVFPGREQDYLNVMKSDFLPHFNKANFYHVNGSVAFGGENGFIHLFYVNNFAALDAGSPVVRALGPVGAQGVTAKLSGIVSSSELLVARVIPDLSYGPVTRPATNP
jgi:hypothetical protein